MLTPNVTNGFESQHEDDPSVFENPGWHDSNSSSTRSSPEAREFPPLPPPQGASLPFQSSSKLYAASPPETSKDPADVLLKIFPYLDPAVLRSVLKNCHGDLLKAVEILSPHSMTRLREVRPSGKEYIEQPSAPFTRHISAFSLPGRGIEQPCTCCQRTGFRGYMDNMPAGRMELMKYKHMMQRVADHDVRSQQCRTHLNYFLSLQDANKRLANEVASRRLIRVEDSEHKSMPEPVCFDCKAPARPQDLFCRSCGARIAKTLN